MRVGVKPEFPQRRKKKYRPSSVTSVRTGASFPRGGSQEVVRTTPVLRCRARPPGRAADDALTALVPAKCRPQQRHGREAVPYGGAASPLPPLKSGEGDREAVVGFSDAQEAPKEPLSLATLASSPYRGAKDGGARNALPAHNARPTGVPSAPARPLVVPRTRTLFAPGRVPLCSGRKPVYHRAKNANKNSHSKGDVS